MLAPVLLVACAAGAQVAGPGGNDPATAGAPRPAGGVAPAADDAPCSAFALSLPPGWTGLPTPLAAAEWSAVHGGLDDRLPPAGWADAGTDEAGALVRSGEWTLHVVQLPDRTWAIDSGTNC